MGLVDIILLKEWVMIKLRVCLFLCVGLVICCVRFIDCKVLINWVVLLYLFLWLIWMLKLFKIMSGFGVRIMDFINFENLLRKVVMEIGCFLEYGGWYRRINFDLNVLVVIYYIENLNDFFFLFLIFDIVIVFRYSSFNLLLMWFVWGWWIKL